MIFVIIFFVVMQWLAIWSGVAKIPAKEEVKRKRLFQKLFCTMGLPAIIGLIVGIAIEIAPIPSWISLIVFIALDIIFLCVGEKLFKKWFLPKNTKKKSNNKNLKKVSR